MTHHEQDQIHLPEGVLRHFRHGLSQLIVPLVNPRRIDEDHLGSLVFRSVGTLRPGVNSPDTVPGGLGLVCGNGDFLPYNLIHQGGLSYIRSPHDANKT